MTAGQTLVAVLGFVMLGIVASAVLVPAVLLSRHRRRRRDARLAKQWEWALGECQRRSAHLAFVRRVYQYARRGCKADLEWHLTGQLQDTWFKGLYVDSGVYVVLRGGIGWGPHNANPNVLYVEPNGVVGVVPGEAPRAWTRHQRRATNGRR